MLECDSTGDKDILSALADKKELSDFISLSISDVKKDC
jgi:hypothetical protein